MNGMNEVDPCPSCGWETWDRREERSRSKYNSPIHWAQYCNRCGLLTTQHWLDGCWMGMWWQAGKPDTLYSFRKDTSAKLRDEYDAGR